VDLVMAVTFGTPVVFELVSATTASCTMSGVVSRQPIVLVYVSTTNTAPNTPTDTFSTPYTWTVVDTEICSGAGYVRTYIGTGGAGTSGVITITMGSAIVGLFAVPC